MSDPVGLQPGDPITFRDTLGVFSLHVDLSPLLNPLATWNAIDKTTNVIIGQLWAETEGTRWARGHGADIAAALLLTGSAQ